MPVDLQLRSLLRRPNNKNDPTIQYLNKVCRCLENMQCALEAMKHDGLPTLKEHSAGLFNLGNTCYINAIAQSLANTPSILRNFFREFKPEDLNTESLSGGLILKEFSKLLRDLWNEEKPFQPIAFHKQVGIFEPIFGDHSQQDAMEYLQYLLERLHQDFNQLGEYPENVQSNDEGINYWQEYCSIKRSPIIKTFAGQKLNTLCCQSCGNISKRYEIIWNISLPLPKKNKTISLLDCFGEHFKDEVFEDRICSNCNNKGSTNAIEVSRWPEILIIQLIRFSATGKIDTMVKCPLNLDIVQHGPPMKYDLRAVVNYFGNSVLGHYTASCKHPTTNKWFNLNDEKVKQINSDHVITSNAYLLFYEMIQ
ncbi:USP2 [Cordylochernes scorpioides]|uniref:ubiquitinyl hydrolase 1 n=1 Tax=Cordylochernes scorpioides TaxID=51811 RepID=A0ABY6KS67_9ARAC|nr:USP2 [Cordylochernes scorpioides]